MNLQESSQNSFFCQLPSSSASQRKPYSLKPAQQACAALDSQRDYKRSLMELNAPQDGTIKDIAATTVAALVVGWQRQTQSLKNFRRRLHLGVR